MVFSRRCQFIPCCFLSLLLLVATAAPAMQTDASRDSGISLRLDDIVGAATNGEIIGATLALSNMNVDSLYGRLQVHVSSGLSILGNETLPIAVDGSGKLFLPIKLQVSTDAQAGTQELVVRAFSDTGELLAVADVRIEVQPKRSVWLQPISTQELMRHIGDSLVIRVNVRNHGNTQEQVKILASYPSSSGGRLFTSIPLKLSAAADTIVRFGWVIDRNLLSQEHFTIHLTGLYANDDIFGNASVNVLNAMANRKYVDPAASVAYLNSYQTNRLSFMVRNPAMDTQSWQMDGSATYALGQGDLRFNLFAYQWGELDRNPVVQNTWLEYQTDKMAVTIGNLNENLETFVYGRGAKVRLSDSAQSEHIEFGIVERTFDLFGSDYQPNFHNGFAAFFRTRLGEGVPDRKRYTGTAVYEHSPRENSESIVYMSSFDLLPQAMSDRMQLVVDFGPGLMRPLKGAVRDNDYQPSLASGLQFHGRVSGFNISSTNYYSTGYYPGVRRGALQLNQRISRAIARTSLWGGYSLYEYAPQYFESQRFLQNRFLVLRVELGATFPVNDFTSLSISPLYEYERGEYSFYGMGDDHQQMYLRSYRISTGLNWRARHYKQYGYFTFENGLLHSLLLKSPQWQGRLNLSYNYDWLNVNANLQRGSFSLMELANNWYFQRDDMFRLGLSVAARKAFYGNKLRTDVGLGYYRDSFSGKNWTGTARVHYAVTPKTQLFAFGQLYHYGNAYYPGLYNANVQLGVQQLLPGRQAISDPKKGTIELSIYYDNNRDGRYGEGDTPAANIMVLIDNTIFITDDEGKLSYRSVPYGRKRISVPVQQGWYASVTELNLDSRREKASIPLQQAGTVVGRIRFDFDERISYEVNTGLGGYTITAKSSTGFMARTITDNDGNYTLFLPAGDYEMSLSESRMPQHVYPDVSIRLQQVIPQVRTEGPEFILRVEARTIEVKRFSSP